MLKLFSIILIMMSTVSVANADFMITYALTIKQGEQGTVVKVEHTITPTGNTDALIKELVTKNPKIVDVKIIKVDDLSKEVEKQQTMKEELEEIQREVRNMLYDMRNERDNFRMVR